MTRTIRAVLLSALTTVALVAGMGSGHAAITGTAPATVALAAPAEPDNIAHRGSSGVAPENTLAAVRTALRHHADVVENDIQRTSDGELVILHDTSLARTTDVEQVFPDRSPWHVGTFTLAEIKQLDAGSWFAPRFAGEQVPTLREWVEAVGSSAGMLLEAKTPELYPGIEHDIDAELRSIPAFNRAVKADRVVMQSFNHTWLRAYSDVAPDVPVGLLFSTRPTDADMMAASTWADQVNPRFTSIDQTVVARVHELGMEIGVWTINDGAGMRRAIDWGVDGIITNYPQVLDDILRE
jgi:glycerophosphoryl diester phosphodiesterase